MRELVTWSHVGQTDLPPPVSVVVGGGEVDGKVAWERRSVGCAATGGLIRCMATHAREGVPCRRAGLWTTD